MHTKLKYGGMVMKTKIIVVGSLFATIAALFQLTPVFFSEFFIFMTIFSAIPIYIVSRINYKAGILSYFVAAMIVMTLSVHEGLFFLCTNGIVGLSLGICSNYTEKKPIIWFTSALMLTIALSIMNYGIGIPVFGGKVPGAMVVQIGIIFLVSMVYNIFYYYITSFIFQKLQKHINKYVA